MDSSPKPAAPGLDPKMQAQPANATNPDATLRTPDGDITIRAPGPPVPVPSGDVTFRLPNQQAGMPIADAARTPSQPAPRAASPAKAVPAQSSRWARVARPALAAVSVALLLGIGAIAGARVGAYARELGETPAVLARYSWPRAARDTLAVIERAVERSA